MSYFSEQSITEPSWRGHLETRMDALQLVHAARLGFVTLVPRRPSGAEMRRIVDAGTIFVFEVKGSFNNWNDYSTQWTHLHNGMRRGGFTNSVSATVVPEFRKKITRFQIGNVRYQVVCYHNDVSRANTNLSRFPRPVIANSIPQDQFNTSTTLNFKLKGCNEHGYEIYEWVRTSEEASETDDLLEEEAVARQASRKPLPLPAPINGPDAHDDLLAGLYPEENLTYKYKYRYKKTIQEREFRYAQPQQQQQQPAVQYPRGYGCSEAHSEHSGAAVTSASRDGHYAHSSAATTSASASASSSASHRRGNGNEYPPPTTSSTSSSTSPTSYHPSDRSRSPVSRSPPGPAVATANPPRDYYAHLGTPGPRYTNSYYTYPYAWPGAPYSSTAPAPAPPPLHPPTLSPPPLHPRTPPHPTYPSTSSAARTDARTDASNNQSFTDYLRGSVRQPSFSTYEPNNAAAQQHQQQQHQKHQEREREQEREHRSRSGSNKLMGPPPPPPPAPGYRPEYTHTYGAGDAHGHSPHYSNSSNSSPPPPPSSRTIHSAEYGSPPNGWRLIAPAPASGPSTGGGGGGVGTGTGAGTGAGIPSARELIDGAMRKEAEREHSRRPY